MIAAKHRVDLSDPRLLYDNEIYTLTSTFGTDTHATTLNIGFDFEFGFGLVFVIFGIFFSFLFLQLVGNLEEGAGQATRILLIAIAHCKPDTNELNACHEEIREYKLRYIHKPQAQQSTYLSEAEEDAETTAQLEGVVDFILQQGATWSAVAQRILRVDTTLFVHQFAAWLVGIGDGDAAGGAGGIEAAAEESILHMFTHLRRHRLPALLGKLLLLLGIDSQAGASNGELNQEQHEQNDHVLYIGGKRHRVKGNQYKPNRSVTLSNRQIRYQVLLITLLPLGQLITPQMTQLPTVCGSRLQVTYEPSHSLQHGASIASLEVHLEA